MTNKERTQTRSKGHKFQRTSIGRSTKQSAVDKIKKKTRGVSTALRRIARQAETIKAKEEEKSAATLHSHQVDQFVRQFDDWKIPSRKTFFYKEDFEVDQTLNPHDQLVLLVQKLVDHYSPDSSPVDERKQHFDMILQFAYALLIKSLPTGKKSAKKKVKLTDLKYALGEIQSGGMQSDDTLNRVLQNVKFDKLDVSKTTLSRAMKSYRAYRTWNNLKRKPKRKQQLEQESSEEELTDSEMTGNNETVEDRLPNGTSSESSESDSDDEELAEYEDGDDDEEDVFVTNNNPVPQYRSTLSFLTGAI